ncbi:lipoate--protein ligase family protein [bacterium]|nr:lipoate--protein ligase family protein [bacterium]
MEFIPYEIKTGKQNMNIDSDLLDYAINNKLSEPIFRLYGWSPACVSLGRNQDDKFLDYKLLRHCGIDVVRRLTGGRALLHDNEITYSYICPVSYLEHGEHVVSSYKEICGIFINKFSQIGIDIDFGSHKQIKTGFDYCMLISTGADLCYKGKKLIGSAQCRKHGYILQHGSILYDYDKKLLEKIFGEEISTEEITCIKEINPTISKEDIIKLFIES